MGTLILLMIAFSCVFGFVLGRFVEKGMVRSESEKILEDQAQAEYLELWRKGDQMTAHDIRRMKEISKEWSPIKKD